MTPCSSPVELSNAFVFTAFVLVEVGINLFDDCIEILVLPQRATGGYFAAARGTLLLAAAEAALDTAAAKTVHAFHDGPSVAQNAKANGALWSRV